MHIKSIGFKSICQLNASVQDQHHDYDQAFEHLPGLKLARFNLLIGENGARKSTVIDMITALSLPDVLHRLQACGWPFRENHSKVVGQIFRTIG